MYVNPQILNPSYSFCNTLIDSKDVLFNMMGKEEAMDVMLKNPAVLTCGPSLDTLGPDEAGRSRGSNITAWALPCRPHAELTAALESPNTRQIKGFANLRSLGNRIPEAARGLALVLLFTFVLYPILAVNNDALQDSWITQVTKVGNGILFAILVEGSRIVIVGTIVKGKMSGDERYAKAQENEKRRMGKGAFRQES